MNNYNHLSAKALHNFKAILALVSMFMLFLIYIIIILKSSDVLLKCNNMFASNHVCVDCVARPGVPRPRGSVHGRPGPSPHAGGERRGQHQRA